MPVLTRNQRKNFASEKILFRNKFVAEVKDLLYSCQTEIHRENKMQTALKIYSKLNKELIKIISVEGLQPWITFIATIFNKSTQFIEEKNLGVYSNVDKNLVDSFFEEISQTRKFAIDIIKNYNGSVCHPYISEARNEISRLENSRPRRNINRVNYTGMDIIEPESEYDGNTDIWSDKTIKNDPDYNPEDEDEDEDEDEKPRYSKFNAKLTTGEKADLKLIEHHRAKRNLPRINYAGMDMTDEDEGKINISKRWFEDGKVKYIWKSYPLSKANEIEDEDYVDDN